MRGKSGEAAEVVTAHEIGTYVYCPEQWRLEYGLGLEPENRSALQAGNRHHARKARSERAAGRLIDLARALVIVAAILLFVLWVLSR